MAEPISAANGIEPAQVKPLLATIRSIVEQFSLNDTLPLLHAIQNHLSRTDLNLAVFGRFKAGKSSFLNTIIGRDVLPIGVVPVTAAVTEITFAETPRAEIVLANGSGITPIEFGSAIAHIAGHAPETQRAEIVRLGLPEMAAFPGLRLVDTPGLESVFLHNTASSLSWSPNVDLALVAVAADPPLTAHDLTLIENLLRYTPSVSVLLSKMDTLDSAGQSEVTTFVEARLRERFAAPIRVFPFSIRPEYAQLRQAFRFEYLEKALSESYAQHQAILAQKLRTLLTTIADYLRLALTAATTRSSDRDQLASAVLGNPWEQADLKLQFQLTARHAISTTRSHIESNVLHNAATDIAQRLHTGFATAQNTWQGSLAKVLSQFEQWLRQVLLAEMSAVSSQHRETFLQPVRDAQRQFCALLQSWRDQLSQKVQALYGVPLRTTQSQIDAPSPRAPDLSISRVFDRNWELLSLLIPMSIFRPTVLRHFAERLDAEVYKNLSRLTTQWEEIATAAIRALQQQSEEQFAQLLQTVQRLLISDSMRNAQDTAAALAKIDTALQNLEAQSPSQHPVSDNAAPPLH